MPRARRMLRLSIGLYACKPSGGVRVLHARRALNHCEQTPSMPQDPIPLRRQKFASKSNSYALYRDMRWRTDEHLLRT